MHMLRQRPRGVHQAKGHTKATKSMSFLTAVGFVPPCPASPRKRFSCLRKMLFSQILPQGNCSGWNLPPRSLVIVSLGMTAQCTDYIPISCHEGASTPPCLNLSLEILFEQLYSRFEAPKLTYLLR